MTTKKDNGLEELEARINKRLDSMEKWIPKINKDDPFWEPGEMANWKWDELENLLSEEFEKGEEHTRNLMYILINKLIDESSLDAISVAGILEQSKARVLDETVDTYREHSHYGADKDDALKAAIKKELSIGPKNLGHARLLNAVRQGNASAIEVIRKKYDID